MFAHMIEFLLGIILIRLLAAVALLVVPLKQRSGLDGAPLQLRFDALEKGQKRLERLLPEATPKSSPCA